MDLKIQIVRLVEPCFSESHPENYFIQIVAGKIIKTGEVHDLPSDYEDGISMDESFVLRVNSWIENIVIKICQGDYDEYYEVGQHSLDGKELIKFYGQREQWAQLVKTQKSAARKCITGQMKIKTSVIQSGDKSIGSFDANPNAKSRFKAVSQAVGLGIAHDEIDNDSTSDVDHNSGSNEILDEIRPRHSLNESIPSYIKIDQEDTFESPDEFPQQSQLSGNKINKGTIYPVPPADNTSNNNIQHQQTHPTPAPQKTIYPQPKQTLPPPQPSAPAHHKLSASVYPQPSASIYPQPNVPMYSQQSAPIYAPQPSAPIYAPQPSAPIYPQPIAPVYPHPEAPTNPTYQQLSASGYQQLGSPAYPAYPQGNIPGYQPQYSSSYLYESQPPQQPYTNNPPQYQYPYPQEPQPSYYGYQPYQYPPSYPSTQYPPTQYVQPNPTSRYHPTKYPTPENR